MQRTQVTNITDREIAAELADHYPVAPTVTSDPAFRRELALMDRGEVERLAYLLHLQLIDATRVAERVRRDVRGLFSRLGIDDDDGRKFVAVDADESWVSS